MQAEQPTRDERRQRIQELRLLAEQEECPNCRGMLLQWADRLQARLPDELVREAGHVG